MADVQDLINALGSGNKANANDVFSSLMSDKINTSLDDKRIEMASQFGAPEEPVDMQETEEEYDEEESFDNDEIQGFSEDETE